MTQNLMTPRADSTSIKSHMYRHQTTANQ